MFGLCFVYTTGTLIFILSYALEPLLLRISRQRNKNLEWITTDTLHLQALGFQGRGRGIWSRLTRSVPITEPGEVLEPLFPGAVEMSVESVGQPPMRVKPEVQSAVVSFSLSPPSSPAAAVSESGSLPAHTTSHLVNDDTSSADTEPTRDPTIGAGRAGSSRESGDQCHVVRPLTV